MKKKLILSITLVVVLLFSSMTVFAFTSQEKVKGILNAMGVQTDDEHFYLYGIPIKQNIYTFDEITNKLTLNKDVLDPDFIEFLELRSKLKSKADLDRFKQLSIKLNSNMKKYDLKGIFAVITFNEPLTQQEIDELFSSYGQKYTTDSEEKYNYKSQRYQYSDENNPLYESVGMLVKDIDSLEKLQNDKRIFVVDTHMDRFHAGRTQKSCFQRNGKGFGSDDFGNSIASALRRLKNTN